MVGLDDLYSLIRMFVHSCSCAVSKVDVEARKLGKDFDKLGTGGHK